MDVRGGMPPQTPVRPAADSSHYTRRISNRVQETPGSRLPVLKTPASGTCPLTHLAARSRPSTSRVLRETNSENVPPTTPKSEAGVLPRHKTVDEVTRVAEARLKDLRQDKYMLLNEREDLKTEIQLGRQRELKLKMQVDKLEGMIARYKERASQHQHFHEEHAILQRDRDTMEEELRTAREQAAHDAARCVQLETELDDVHTHYASMCDAANGHTEHMWHYLSYMHAQHVQEKADMRRARQALELQVAQLQQRLITQETDASHVSDIVEQQRVQISTLSMEQCQLEQALQQAEQHTLALTAHVDDSAEHDAYACVELQDQCDLLSVDAMVSRIDALCSQSQWETEKERSDWLSSRLHDTEAAHHHMLQVLKNERAKHAEDLEAQKEMASAQERITTLLQVNAELSDELDRVAWFEEAYQARTQQANLLKELAKVNEEHEEQMKGLQTLHAHEKKETELEGLSTRLELLYKEEYDLQQRRNALAWHAQELGEFIAKQSEAAQEPRRRVSDTAFVRAKRAHAHSPLHS
ncbi:hypothetical protein MCAP1_000801 [Malassezia caprae]|uniref:Uncharacterized protein n=1 Tax=Malassezia caprae TaxID=1381934 RepID=A0AAF0E5J2_9BASI|nr:hypothetical protein MCAP1_000801 [Malassezia caprae]